MKKILLFFLCLLLFIPNVFASTSSAYEYVLMDMDTGRVLASKNKDSPRLIASITKIMIERNITINKLASISCLTQSTVDSLINGKSKNSTILTIVRTCDGLRIKLNDFFDDELFDNLDRED